MKFLKKTSFYFLLAIIILTSFFLYSSNRYPLLSSDDALNILMAHYYQLPHDVYCWGQDRGGAIIPLIAQIFIKLFGCSAVTSVSISNYLLLIAGFLGFSSLFKTKGSKLLFAVVWFLPFQRFIDITRFYVGMGYSLIGVAIFFINKLSQKEPPYTFKDHLMFLAIIITLTLAIWTLDLAIVTVVVLLLTLLLFDILENKKLKINKTVLFYTVSGIIFCFSVIMIAKSFAVIKTENYLTINNFSGIKASFSILKDRFAEVLTFQTNELLVSIYTYCVIIFFIAFIIFLIVTKSWKILICNKFVVFFTTDFVAIFCTFLIASWVLANEMGRWYYVACYISLSMAILLSVEMLSTHSKKMKYFQYSLIFIILLGAVTPIYTMKHTYPKSLTPRLTVVKEFEQLGNIGVVAEFWNAYIMSCSNPEKIKATPHDKEYIRSQLLVDAVFERENIYVIRDSWMKSFPDTLEQFGYILLKNGQDFRLSDCDVCKYLKIKLEKHIPIEQLKYDPSQMIYDSTIMEDVLHVSQECNVCKENHIVFGPYMSIGVGTFTADFILKADHFTNDNPIATLDVVADYGNIVLISKTISRNDFTSIGYLGVPLEFETKTRFNNLEFRILYYGNADLYFEGIELRENKKKNECGEK